VPGLPEPVFTRNFTARVAGMLTERLDALATIGYVEGQPAVGRGLSFATYLESVRLSLALTATLAAYGVYMYYSYDFRNYQRLLPGAPPAFARTAARVGLTLFVPVIER
jgi:hypothetical protein